MKICFFTMSDFSLKGISKLTLARNLIYTGVKFDRPIWYYRIPRVEDKKRYKIKLLKSSMLPDADKYVYMDADCLMLGRGNWESDKVYGARVEGPRHHRLDFKTPQEREHFIHILSTKTKPECNTGCVVLPADKRREIAERWEYWCQYVDNLLLRPSGTRDQFHFRFVRKEFDIPDLPPEYCSLATVEPIPKGSCFAHFTAFPRSYKRVYKPVYNALMGKELHELGPTDVMGGQWMTIVDLVLKYAENPTFATGAEIGVHKGQTTHRLMQALPGLKLYCIDPWKDIPEQKKPWEHYYEEWLKVKALYSDRIIEQRCFSLQAQVEEKLDFVFIDGDHTALAVENDIRFWSKKVKPGGVIIGHDLGYRGTYYDRESVKRGVEAVFGKNYKLGPGFIWWIQKR